VTPPRRQLLQELLLVPLLVLEGADTGLALDEGAVEAAPRGGAVGVHGAGRSAPIPQEEASLPATPVGGAPRVDQGRRLTVALIPGGTLRRWTVAASSGHVVRAQLNEQSGWRVVALRQAENSSVAAGRRPQAAGTSYTSVRPQAENTLRYPPARQRLTPVPFAWNKGLNKSGWDFFNNYYKFWRLKINFDLFQQKQTSPPFQSFMGRREEKRAKTICETPTFDSQLPIYHSKFVGRRGKSFVLIHHSLPETSLHFERARNGK
jgi:hypothetical protein